MLYCTGDECLYWVMSKTFTVQFNLCNILRVPFAAEYTPLLHGGEPLPSFAFRTCFDFLIWAPSGSAGLGPKVMPLVQIAPNLGP